jgi:hypothetical protein
MKRLLAVLALGLGTVHGTVATAQSLSDQWKFGASIYGWFPELGGQTTFPPRSGGESISVSADTILENLKFVFMGTFEAQRGRWGMFTDVVYMDVGDSKTSTRDLIYNGVTLPAGVTANTNFDLKMLVWTLAGTYRVVAEPGATFDVLAGARLLDVKEKLGYSLYGNVGQISVPGRSGTREADQSLWDGVVGVKGRLAFGADHQWYVPYYLDVGTGQSDLTWQAFAGLGYAFKWGGVVAGYRYLDYNMKSGQPIEELNAGGPIVGVSFNW